MPQPMMLAARPIPSCVRSYQVHLAGSNVHDPADPEGFVHISNGIHGIGDLAADGYDWDNPVAHVRIVRMD